MFKTEPAKQVYVSVSEREYARLLHVYDLYRGIQAKMDAPKKVYTSEEDTDYREALDNYDPTSEQDLDDLSEMPYDEL